MEGVPSSLPSIVKAHRIQDKARNVGFDWEERSQVWDKVQEEFKELKAEVEQLNADQMEAEFGDLFFSLINAARLYKINPDNALERTNQKFIRLFNYLDHPAGQIVERDEFGGDGSNLERSEIKRVIKNKRGTDITSPPLP